jgi:hypothetical protein
MSLKIARWIFMGLPLPPSKQKLSQNLAITNSD